MSITHKLPKLADRHEQEFRFITEPTPALRQRAVMMARDALVAAVLACDCECPPWIDCDHGDRSKAEKWLLRARKLAGANDAALMEVLSAPVGDHWPVVDALVMGSDDVARP